MSESLRAVYRHGQIELLDPAELEEGQELQVTPLSPRDMLLQALGGLAVQPEGRAASDDSFFDDATLLEIIQAGVSSDVDLAQAILDERQDGP